MAKTKNRNSILSLLEEEISISIVKNDGTIVYVNPLFCKLSMYKEKELVGKHIQSLNILGNTEAFLDDVSTAFKTEKTIQRSITRKRKNGETYSVQATIIPIYDAENNMQQFATFEIDTKEEGQINIKYAEALNELKNFENALIQSAVVVITDINGNITYMNEKFCKLSKYSAEELIGQNHRIINSGHHPQEFFDQMWHTINQGKIWVGDIKNRAKDGSTYWVNTTIIPFLDKKKKPYQYVAIRHDITARKTAEYALQKAQQNDFQKTVKNLHNAIFKYQKNNDGKIDFTLLEGKLAERMNITLENLTGGKLYQSYTPREVRENLAILHDALDGIASDFEFNYLDFTFLISLSPITENEEVKEVVGTISDITDRIEAENKIKHMAYYDILTDLPNQRLFEQKVNEAITLSAKSNTPFTTMLINLDGFKYINDSMGHSIGDELLKSVACRIQKVLGNNDTVGRQGGDEFVLLLRDKGSSHAETVAKNLIDALEKPFIFQGNDVFINVSIGISVFPKDGNSSMELIQNAGVAMYQIKGQKLHTYHFFTEELHKELLEKSALSNDLRTAIETNQLTLYYQPQINLEKGKVIGVEALIRWHHPTYGMVSPARFIPIAEETGLIVPIGKWVLETACVQAKKWHDAGFSSIQMSVNVSPREFRQSSFVEQVRTALQKSGLAPQYLNLEITESMMSDVHHCQVMLGKLRALGVDVSVDDFGTGYSSLSYLNSFPLTHLKIDQAFVRDLNYDNRAIVKTIISLANNLNLKVVAEGVETEEQADLLKTLSCFNVQGFLYSKPLPAKEIEPLFKAILSSGQ